MVKEAFDVLSDPSRRDIYDSDLKEGRSRMTENEMFKTHSDNEVVDRKVMEIVERLEKLHWILKKSLLAAIVGFVLLYRFLSARAKLHYLLIHTCWCLAYFLYQSNRFGFLLSSIDGAAWPSAGRPAPQW